MKRSAVNSISNEMRILHSIPYFPYFEDNKIVGGAANALRNLVIMQSCNHATTIAGPMPRPLRNMPGRYNVNFAPLQCHGVPGTTRYGLRYTWAITKWISENRDIYDIVHFHSGFLDYVLASRLSRAFGGPPTVHTLYCPVNAGDGRWANSLYRQILLRCVNSVDAFTAISQNVRQSLVNYGVRRNKLPVVPPVVDFDRFYPAKNATLLRSAFRLPASTFVLLFVGNLKPAKNLAAVLKAFADVRQSIDDAYLVITTELKYEPDQERSSSIATMIRDLGIEDYVRQFGIIDDMGDLMRASDVLIAPFLDTFGPSDYFMAALEAMASGIPVIVSPVGAMPEVMSPDIGMQVDPTKPREIADAMLKLANDPDRRIHMGKAAAEVIRNRFSGRQIAERYDQIYQEVC